MTEALIVGKDFPLLLHLILLEELLNTSFGVHDLLFSRIERMADRANFHADILTSGTGREGVSTLADDGRVLVVRMNSCFHKSLSFRKPTQAAPKSAYKQPYYYIRKRVPTQCENPDRKSVV